MGGHVQNEVYFDQFETARNERSQECQLNLMMQSDTTYVQVVLCQTNIFCHQLIQNTDFVRFTKLFRNSKHKFTIFEFQKNLCKSVVIFWVNCQLVTKYDYLKKNKLL